jgi:hypothetical protein
MKMGAPRSAAAASAGRAAGSSSQRSARAQSLDLAGRRVARQRVDRREGQQVPGVGLRELGEALVDLPHEPLGDGLVEWHERGGRRAEDLGVEPGGRHRLELPRQVAQLPPGPRDDRRGAGLVPGRLVVVAVDVDRARRPHCHAASPSASAAMPTRAAHAAQTLAVGGPAVNRAGALS